MRGSTKYLTWMIDSALYSRAVLSTENIYTEKLKFTLLSILETKERLKKESAVLKKLRETNRK